MFACFQTSHRELKTDVAYPILRPTDFDELPVSVSSDPRYTAWLTVLMGLPVGVSMSAACPTLMCNVLPQLGYRPYFPAVIIKVRM